LLPELSKYLETAGINDPFSKIYITTDHIDNLALLVFLFTISQVNKFQFQEHLSVLIHKKDKKSYDGTLFVCGIVTLLKQFHSSNTTKFLAYLGQYIRAFVNTAMQGETKSSEFPEEVTCCLLFLEEFLKFSSIDRKLVEGFFPSYIFDHFHH